MKKILAAILALSLALSLTACGDKTEPAPEAAPESSVADAPAAESQTVDAANPEFTPEQQAIAQKLVDMATRHDAVAEKVNADPNLAEMQEVVTAMNEIADAMVEVDAAFADPANLTAEVIAELDVAVVNGNLFLDEIEAMLANYAGKNTVTVKVEIVNETGADLHALAMSPANDENWGGNLLSEPLTAGSSGTTEMTFTEDSLIWDLMAADSQENTLTFMGLDFSVAPMEGAKLVLSATEGGAYMAAFQ